MGRLLKKSSTTSEPEKRKKITNQIVLHGIILILALSFVASKIASNYMSEKGLFSIECIIALGAYAVLTVIYAIGWQYSLERFPLSFLYTNRSLYMIWSLLFAILIFNNDVYWNNVLGLLFIVVGVVLNSRDA